MRLIDDQKGSFGQAAIRFLRSAEFDDLSPEIMERIAAEMDEKETAYYPEVCYLIANYYHVTGAHKKAYFYFYKTLNSAPDLSDQSKPYLHEFHEKLGINYFYFERYDEAIKHLHKALSFENCTKRAYINANNTLGLIYRDKKDFRKSKYYLKMAYKVAVEQNDEVWIGILSGNLGFLEYQERNYDEARRLIGIDLEISSKNKQTSSEFNALTSLIRIKIIEDDTEGLDTMIRRLTELCEIDESIETKRAYYGTISFYLEKMGDYENAMKNYKIEQELQDSILANRDALAIRNYEFQIDFEKKQSEIEVLKQKRANDSFISYAIIVFLLTLLLASILIVRQVVKRRKKEKEIFFLKQSKIVDELRNSERELNTIVTTLIDKNALIEQLKSKIDNGDANQELNEQQEKLLETLQSFTLLTEEDWITFKKVFEKLHPGFFVYFKREYPEVTTSEIRLATLIRLNLSISEMASALGISPNSVRKTSLRLRKKLNISSVDLLVKFILELDTSL